MKFIKKKTLLLKTYSRIEAVQLQAVCLKLNILGNTLKKVIDNFNISFYIFLIYKNNFLHGLETVEDLLKLD